MVNRPSKSLGDEPVFTIRPAFIKGVKGLAALIAIVALIAIGVGIEGARNRARAEAAPAPQTLMEHEDIASYMQRLGFQRWVVACAYAHAKAGDSREVAEANCSFEVPKGVR